jgi:AbrB family transcriptional regulator, transcriptional pleiotropic regulator of transition state genes
MASSGIRRKVDDLGRVVIPAGIRRSLGIREGDPVEVSVEGERVVLAKPRDACVFCGREEERLTPFRGRLVCRDCLGSLGAVDGRLRETSDAEAAGGPTEPRGPADLPDWEAPSRRAAPTVGARPGGRPAPRPAPGPRPAPTASSTPGEPHDATPHRPAPASTPAVEPVEDAPATEPPHVPQAPAVETSDAEHSEDPDDARTEPGRRRPPYDPASTTAW